MQAIFSEGALGIRYVAHITHPPFSASSPFYSSLFVVYHNFAIASTTFNRMCLADAMHVQPFLSTFREKQWKKFLAFHHRMKMLETITI